MENMAGSSTEKMTARERRRRRILMNDEDEDDGTPNKIESFIQSETSFTSFNDTDNTINVTGDEKQIHFLEESDDVSAKDVHFITSEENMNVLESQSHSSSVSEERHVNHQQIKHHKTKPDEDLNNETVGPGMQSKRARFTKTDHQASVDITEEQIQLKTDKIGKDVDRELLDALEKQEFSDVNESGAVVAKSHTNDGLMQISEGNTLPRETNGRNSEDTLSVLSNMISNQQEIIQIRDIQEIPCLKKTNMVTKKVPNEQPDNDRVNTLKDKVAQQVTTQEFSAKNTHEDTTRHLDSGTPNSFAVTVKRKVRFLAYHPESSLLDKKSVETDINTNNRTVFKTSTTNSYKETKSDLEAEKVCLPLKTNGHTFGTNQGGENTSRSWSKALERSRLQDDCVDEVLEAQTPNSRILPAQQSLHTPVERSHLYPDKTLETFDNIEENSDRETKKYRVHCYLELNSVIKADSRKLTRKWKSEPTLNLRRLRTNRSKSLNLEKNKVQKQSSLVIRLKKPSTPRPLVPAYSLNVQPFETLIRNQVNLKLKKKRRKSYPPPTSELLHYLASRTNEFHAGQTPKLERRDEEINGSFEALNKNHGDETDYKTYKDDIFNKENYSVENVTQNSEMWMESHANPTEIRSRNAEKTENDFQEKPRKPHLNVTSLTIRPKSFKEEPLHAAVTRLNSKDITFGRVESTNKYKVDHDVTSEKPRDEIVIEETPTWHLYVPKNAKLDPEELMLEKKMISHLEETPDDNTPTWPLDERTFQHEEMNKAVLPGVDNRRKMQVSELDRHQQTSNNAGTQTTSDLFVAPEKIMKPVKRRHKPRHGTDRPKANEETETYVDPFLSPSRQPALEQELVGENRQSGEVKDILNIQRYFESSNNEFSTKGRTQNEFAKIYSHPSIPETLEKESAQQQNVDMPEANTILLEIPKSQSTINIQQYLENTKQDDKGQDDNGEAEEILEPIEPYQVNLEIQKLLLNTPESEDEPVQSPPVKIQQEIQVILVDEIKKKRQKSKKTSQKGTQNKTSKQGKEQDQMMDVTTTQTDVPKIQERKDRPKTKEQAVQTPTIPEYTDIDSEDYSNLTVSGFQPRPVRPDSQINAIPEEDDDQPIVSIQHQDNLTLGNIVGSDELIEAKYQSRFEERFQGLLRKTEQMTDQTITKYKYEETGKASVNDKFALKNPPSGNEEPLQTPPVKKQEKTPVYLVEEEKEPIKPTYQVFGFESLTQRNSKAVQPLPTEKQQKSVDNLAEEEPEPTKTLYKQIYGIQEVELEGQTKRKQKRIKPPRDKNPQKSAVKIVEQELKQPRYEIQGLLLEEKPIQAPPIEKSAKSVAPLFEEEPESMEASYQPSYEKQDYAFEENLQRKIESVQSPILQNPDKSSICFTEEQQEPAKLMYESKYEIQDFVSEGRTQKREELIQPPPVKKPRKSASFLAEEERESIKTIYQPRNEMQDILSKERTQTREKPVRATSVKSTKKSEFHLVEEDPKSTKPVNVSIHEIQDFVLKEHKERKGGPVPTLSIEKQQKKSEYLEEKELVPVEPISWLKISPKYETQDFLLEEHKEKKEEDLQPPHAKKLEKYVVHSSSEKSPVQKTDLQTDTKQDFVLQERNNEPQPVKLMYEKKIAIKTFVAEEPKELQKGTTSVHPDSKPVAITTNLTEQMPDQIPVKSKNKRKKDVQKSELEKEAISIPPMVQAGETMVTLVEETPKFENKTISIHPIEELEETSVNLVEEISEQVKSRHESKLNIQTFVVENTPELELVTTSIRPIIEPAKVTVDLMTEMPEPVKVKYESKVEGQTFAIQETSELEKETTLIRPVKEPEKVTVYQVKQIPETVKFRKMDLETFVSEEKPELETETISVHPVKELLTETDSVKEPGKLSNELFKDLPEPFKPIYESNMGIHTFFIEETTGIGKETISRHPFQDTRKITVDHAEQMPKPVRSKYEKKAAIPIRAIKEANEITVILEDDMPEPLKHSHERKVDIETFVIGETPDVETEKISIRPVKEPVNKTVDHLKVLPDPLSSRYDGKVDIQTFVIEETPEIEKEKIAIHPFKEPVKEVVDHVKLLPEQIKSRHDRKMDIPTVVIQETPELGEKAIPIDPIKGVWRETGNLVRKMPEQVNPMYQRNIDIQTFVEEKPLLEKETTSTRPIWNSDETTLKLASEPVTSRQEREVEFKTFADDKTPELDEQSVSIPTFKETQVEIVDPLDEMTEPAKFIIDRKVNIQQFVLKQIPGFQKEIGSIRPVKDADEKMVSLEEEMPEPLNSNHEKKGKIQTFVLEETPEIQKETSSVHLVEDPVKQAVDLMEVLPAINIPNHDRKVDIQTVVIQGTPESVKEGVPVCSIKEVRKETADLVEKMSKPVQLTYERNIDIQTFVREEKSESEQETTSTQPIKNSEEASVILDEQAPEQVTSRDERKADIKTFVDDEIPELDKESVSICSPKEAQKETVDLLADVTESVELKYGRKVNIRQFVVEQTAEFQKEMISIHPIKDADEITVILEEQMTEPCKPGHVDETLELQKETPLIRPVKETEKATVDVLEEMQETVRSKYERKTDIQRFDLEETQAFQTETISICPFNKTDEIMVGLVEETPESIDRTNERKMDIQTLLMEETPIIEENTISICPIIGPQKDTVDFVEEMPKPVKPRYERNIDIQTFVVEEKPELEKEISSTIRVKNSDEMTVNLVEQASEPVKPRQERKWDFQTFVVDETPEIEKETVSFHPVREKQKVTVDLKEETPVTALETPVLEKGVISVLSINKADKITISVEEEMPELFNQKYDKKGDNQTYVTEDAGRLPESENIPRNGEEFSREEHSAIDETAPETGKNGEDTINISRENREDTINIPRNDKIVEFKDGLNPGMIFSAEQSKIRGYQSERIPNYSHAKGIDDESLKDTGEPWIIVQRKQAINTNVNKSQLLNSDKTKAKVDERVPFDREQVAENAGRFPELENMPTHDDKELSTEENLVNDESAPEAKIWFTVRMKRWESDLRKENRTNCDLNKQKFSQHSNSTISIDGSFDESSPSIKCSSRGGSPTSEGEETITILRNDDTVECMDGVNPEQVEQSNIKDYQLDNASKYPAPKGTNDESFKHSGEPWIIVKHKQARNKDWSKPEKLHPTKTKVKVEERVMSDEEQITDNAGTFAESEIVVIHDNKDRFIEEKDEKAPETNVWLTVRRKRGDRDLRKENRATYEQEDQTLSERSESTLSFNGRFKEHSSSTRSSSRGRTPISDLPWKLESPSEDPWISVKLNNDSFNDPRVRITPRNGKRVIEKSVPLYDSVDGKNGIQHRSDNAMVSMITKQASAKGTANSQNPLNRTEDYGSENAENHDGFEKQEFFKKPLAQSNITQIKATEQGPVVLQADSLNNFRATEFDHAQSMEKSDLKILPWIDVRKPDSVKKRFSINNKKKHHNNTLRGIRATDDNDCLLILKIPPDILTEIENDEEMSDTEIEIPWMELDPSASEIHGSLPWIELTDQTRDSKTDRLLMLKIPRDMILKASKKSTKQEHQINLPWNEVVNYWKETGQIPSGSVLGVQKQRSSNLSLTFPNEADLNKPGSVTTLPQSLEMPDIRLVLPKKYCVDSSLQSKPMITVNPSKNIKIQINKSVKRKHDWKSTLRLSKSDRNKNYSQVKTQDRWIMLVDGATWWRLQVEDIDHFGQVKARPDGHFENTYEIGNPDIDQKNTVNLNQFSRELGRQKKQFSFVIDAKNGFQKKK